VQHKFLGVLLELPGAEILGVDHSWSRKLYSFSPNQMTEFWAVFMPRSKGLPFAEA